MSHRSHNAGESPAKDVAHLPREGGSGEGRTSGAATRMSSALPAHTPLDDVELMPKDPGSLAYPQAAVLSRWHLKRSCHATQFPGSSGRGVACKTAPLMGRGFRDWWASQARMLCRDWLPLEWRWGYWSKTIADWLVFQGRVAEIITPE